VINISQGVIFHQSETNHRRSFYPNQPLPNDAPTEVQIAAAELWTPEFVAEWVAQQNPAPTLEEAIAARVTEIKSHYTTLASTFDYQGHTYQTAKEDEANFIASHSWAQAGNRPSPSPWRTLANENVMFTNEEFLAFYDAILTHRHTLFFQQAAHVDAVRALTTVAEVEAYDYGQ
jgi:hypothetical protein